MSHNEQLECPEMRAELIDTMQVLSNREYQIEAWVHQRFPPGIQEDNLDYAVHFLFDDTPLARSPESCIGVYVKDAREAELIFAVTQAMANILSKYGTSLSDRQYIDTPEWNEVVKGAMAFSQYALSGR